MARLYDAALILGGSVAIAVGAQMAIGYPVPVTGQTFAVLIVAALLGSRRGVLCVLAYLAEGLLGLPVFAQGKGGLACFMGPTGGYLVGFALAAFVVGALSERTWDRRVPTTVAAMVLGNLVIYACGLAWLLCLSRFFDIPLKGGLLAVGLYPFLIGDTLKIILAAILLPGGWGIIRFFRLDAAAEMR
ncbi:MAG: biotin transporter BioY [Planctomycetes bacterium]|nr:biotin transporter BioY [Planctomycetota bacterium]